MNSNDLINEFFSKLYSGNINEFNKFIENNNLSANIKNNNNENALHIIVKSDLSDILKINFIKYLISKNIDINDKDCNGNTPFNLACQKQLFNIMIVLYNSFKNKINLYDKNNNDIQPIYYILKGIIVDELDDYPSPTKFIKNESTLKINDVSNLLNYVKEYVKKDKLFTDKCKNLIEVIKKNINFELQINKSLVDEKIDQFKNKIIQNKNDLSADFKYEFYNEIFNIIKKSHPKTFENIDFVSTKSLDNDGFYLEINGDKTNYKIHGEPTFYQNLENVKQNNLIKIQQYENKYNEMIESLNPQKFFFPFFEEIAHIYYCKEFSKNIERLKNIDQNDEKCNQEKQYTPNFGNQLNDFIEYINSLGNGNSIKKIASGKNHNLILTNKGEVFAFGLNDYGQCGILNRNPFYNYVNEPTLIDGTGDIQDGNINYNNPNTPKPGKIKDIACGENHSLILNEAGTVFSFGNNASGKCGYDPNQNPNPNPNPFANPNTNPGPEWRPFQIPDENIPFENKNITSIACGYNHNLLLRQGDVFTFGDNTNGKLGRPVVQSDHNPTSLNLTGVKKIACGANHSMIIKQDGSVHGFGDDTYGQTGVNRNINLIRQIVNNAFEDNRGNEAGTQNPDKPLLIKGTGTDGPNNIYGEIVDVACGLNHTMILNKRDEVYSFGDNQHGQLGLGNFDISSLENNQNPNNYHDFHRTDGRNSDQQRQQHITLNLLNYFRKTTTNNQNEQKYYFNNNNVNNNVYQPLPITDTLKDYNDNNYKKIKSIACGENHSMIITEAGEVFSFGRHNFGKLGLREENNNNKFSPQQIYDTGYSTYGRIKCASAGENHSLILNKKGNVFSFGDHRNGQLGIVNNGNQVNNNVTTPQKISLDLPQQEQKEKLNSDYIIRNNTLFKDFEISIDNLQKFCEASTYIYIKNIENGEEIFIYNNDDDAQNIFQRQQIGGDVRNSRRLALQIITNKNKLELKINNDSLGKGQFEIKFYNHGFNEIKSVDIKTNEYNETIDLFFDKFLNLILHKVKENIKNIRDKNNINDINKEKNRISNIDNYNDSDDLNAFLYNLTDQFINDKNKLSDHFFIEKNNLKDLIKFYNDSNIDKNDIEKITNELTKSLNFQINETYFDKSKFNINYLEKYFEIFDSFKSLLISSINEKELLEKSKMNKLLINSFNQKLNCESDIIDFKLDNNFNDFIKNISDLKKLIAVESVDIGDEINDYIKNIDESDYKNYLLSPAYQDFYYYFRYHILEDRIKEYNNNNEENVFIKGKIEEELKKIYEYYDFNTDIDTHEIKASKLAILGDILDNLLINKIRNVIFNEINSFVKNIKDSEENQTFEIKDIISFDVDLININNEFDVDLSKMNDKIKKILVDDVLIENKLEYNLGNILIKNVKVQPILYYTNNFFDTNINKQQFILFNKDLKDILKNEIKLDYNLIKSLIENQNINLLRDLKDKILIEYYKIQDLKEYIEQNKINNNKYKYQDFCDNYNYHLEEELKKIQNHKNIFKYYDHLVCTFIYYYENNVQIDMSNDNNINDDLADNFDELNELFREIEDSNLKIDNYINEINNFSNDVIINKESQIKFIDKETDKGSVLQKGEFNKENILLFGEKKITHKGETQKGIFDDKGNLKHGEKNFNDRRIEKGYFDTENENLQFGEKIFKDWKIEKGEFDTKNENLQFGEKINADGKIEKGVFENKNLVFGERFFNDGKIEKGKFQNNNLICGEKINADGKIEKGKFQNNNLKFGEKINADGKIEKGKFDTNNNNLLSGEEIENNISKIVGNYNFLNTNFNELNDIFNEINNFEYVKDYKKSIGPEEEEEGEEEGEEGEEEEGEEKEEEEEEEEKLSEIKEYSKTNIIKRIKKKFEKIITINVERNVINFEKMLIESNDVEDDSNPQLKLEFDTICLSIDLVVGNMYSKLLKRFLLEYLIEKYSSEVDQDDDPEKLKNIDKLKNIIKNIMIKVDELINTKYDGSVFRTTEFTKKLVILHSEGRYKIKNYVDLDEDNLFNEIVNLIKSNPYEKIEEDDIILTYLKDNINDYFKKFYKIAINTLIACSSGINNYILYHNKYKKIVSFLDGIIESKKNKLTEEEKNEKNKKDEEERKKLIEAIKNDNYVDNTITEYSKKNKDKIKDFFKTMF